MAAAMVFRLNRSFISNTAVAEFSFSRGAESPSAALMCSRCEPPAALRIFAGISLADCHPTQISCTVRPAHSCLMLSQDRPSLVELATTLLIAFRRFVFTRAARRLIAMKYCNQSPHPLGLLCCLI